jgi:hypothetical protein
LRNVDGRLSGGWLWLSDLLPCRARRTAAFLDGNRTLKELNIDALAPCRKSGAKSHTVLRKYRGDDSLVPWVEGVDAGNVAPA